MDTEVQADHWDSACRICLKYDGIKIPIFGEGGQHRKVSTLINDCLSILVYTEDPLPKYICNKCFYKLELASELKQECLKSNAILIHFLSTLRNNVAAREYLSLVQEQPHGHQNKKRKLPMITVDLDKNLQMGPPAKHHAAEQRNQPVRDTSMKQTTQESVERTPTSEDQRLYSCKICNRKFTYKKSFQTHNALVHNMSKKDSSGISAFKCNYCDRVFSFHDNLKNHLAQVHECLQDETKKDMQHAAKKTIKCDLCNREFRSLHHLSEHQTNIHKHTSKPEGEQNLKTDTDYACDHCSKSFSSLGALKIHEDSHAVPNVNSSGEQSKLTETIKTEVWKPENGTNMKRSIKWYRVKRIPICLLCKKAFRNGSALWNHMNFYHPKNPGFRCKVCSCVFLSKKGLQTHSTAHQGSRQTVTTKVANALPTKIKGPSSSTESTVSSSSNTTASFSDTPQCEICFKTYQNWNNVKRHMKSNHKSSKIYPCKLCVRLFFNQSNLDSHTQAEHTNTCRYCGIFISSLNHFNRHELSHRRKGDKPLAGIRALLGPGNGKAVPKATVEEKSKLPVATKSENLVKTLAPFRIIKQAIKKNLTCLCCGEYSVSYKDLAMHLKDVHPNQEFFPCPTCGEIFYEISSLRGHTIKHKLKLTMCHHCGRVFARKKFFLRHEKLCKLGIKDSSKNRGKVIVMTEAKIGNTVTYIAKSPPTFNSAPSKTSSITSSSTTITETAPSSASSSKNTPSTSLPKNAQIKSLPKITPTTLSSKNPMSTPEQNLNKKTKSSNSCSTKNVNASKSKPLSMNETYSLSSSSSDESPVLLSKLQDSPTLSSTSSSSTKSLIGSQRKIPVKSTPLKTAPKTSKSSPSMLQCKFCSEKLDGAEKLMMHLQGHAMGLSRQDEVIPESSTITQRHQCEICDSTFMHRKTLVHHKNNIHGIKMHKKKGVQCQLCPRTFKFWRTLSYHSLYVHGCKPKRSSQISVTKDTQQREAQVSNTKTGIATCDGDKIIEDPSIIGPAIYECNICYRVLRTEKSLLEHHSNFHQDSAGTSRTGKDNQSILESLISDDKPEVEQESSECHICYKRFKSQKGLCIHLRVGHGKICCADCLEFFETESELSQHRQIHKTEAILNSGALPAVNATSGNTPKPSHFTCPICSKLFEFEHSYKKHMAYHRSLGVIVPENGLNDQGNKDFTVNDEYNDHQIKEHLTCKGCGNIYGSRVALLQHHRKVHKMKTCFTCLDLFTSDVELAVHKSMAHDVESSKKKIFPQTTQPFRLTYDCSQCDKSFGTRASLGRHKGHHTAQSRQSAAESTENNSNQSFYNVDVSDVEDVSSIHTLSCNLCGNVYDSDRQLKRHMNYHKQKGETISLTDENKFQGHSMDSEVDTCMPQKSFQCSICSKSFETETSFNRHVKYHLDVGDVTPEAEVENEENSGEFSSNIRGKVFSQRASLMQHVVNHKKEENSAPGTPVSTKEYLDKESMSNPNDDLIVLPCSICTKLFSSSVSLRNHMYYHKKKGEYVPNDVTPINSQSETTEIAHSSGSTNQYPCIFCSRVLTTRASLQNHIKYHTNRGELIPISPEKKINSNLNSSQTAGLNNSNDYPCLLCDRSFPTGVGLKNHKIFHIRRGEPWPETSVTPTSSSHSSEVVEVENNSLPCYPCPKCKKSFQSKISFSKHIAYHTRLGDIEPGYVSSLFKDKETTDIEIKESVRGDASTDPRRGVKMTSPSKFYRKKNIPCCLFCKKSFSSLSVVLKHLELIHPRNKYFKCEPCQKVFFTNPGRIRHIMSNNCASSNTLKTKSEPNLDTSSPVKTLAPRLPRCELCKKTFQNWNNVKRHFKEVHSDSQCYECKSCVRIFLDMNDLSVHEASHKILTCRYCSITFTKLSSFHLHEKSHRKAGNKPNILSKTSTNATQGLANQNDIELNQPQEFGNASSYVHQRISKKRPICQYCDLDCNIWKELETHLKVHHPGAVFFKCDKCEEVYFDIGSIKKHKYKHTYNWEKCPYCERMFHMKIFLDKHKKNCPKRRGKLVASSTSAKMFSTINKQPLKIKTLSPSKINSKSQESQMSLQCQFCHVKLKDAHSLINHLQSHAT